MSTAPPNALLDALAEPWRSPLKFLGVLVLTALVAVGGPIALLIGFEYLQRNNPTISLVKYAESGMAIGQSKSALDQRFGGNSPMEAGKATYYLGRISGEV